MISRHFRLPRIVSGVRGVFSSGFHSCYPESVYLIVLFMAMFMVAGCTSTGNTSYESPESPRYERSSAKYHKVRKGDTLYAISFKAGVDFRTLAAWNNLPKPYVIYPGQVLRLVPPLKPTTTARKSSKPSKSTVAKTKPKNQSATRPKTPVTPSTDNLKWTWPTRGKVVSHYSRKDASRDGIKISGKKNQKILAAEAGKVVYVGSGLVGYGRLIIIKHNNKYLSAYGLNNRLLVKEGESVKREQQIALMGVDNSGKPVLHFEIRKYGKPVNPIAYLPK